MEPYCYVRIPGHEDLILKIKDVKSLCDFMEIVFYNGYDHIEINKPKQTKD